MITGAIGVPLNPPGMSPAAVSPFCAFVLFLARIACGGEACRRLIRSYGWLLPWWAAPAGIGSYSGSIRGICMLADQKVIAGILSHLSWLEYGDVNSAPDPGSGVLVAASQVRSFS